MIKTPYLCIIKRPCNNARLKNSKSDTVEELFDAQYNLFKAIALKNISADFSKSKAMQEFFDKISPLFGDELSEMICKACASRLESEIA